MDHEGLTPFILGPRRSDPIYLESHVIVNNGFLKLKTTKEKELLYFTGAICSRDSAYGYGYYEILAKIPFGTGFWPTFWLYRHDNGIYEEIDILDPPGDMPTNSNAFGIMDHLKPTPEIYRSHVYQIPDLSDGFHKIAMEWQKGSVIFYIDDQVIGAYCGNEVPKRSLYLFLNQQLGPYHTQLPDTNYKDHEPTPQTDNSLPQYFEIDYFRYYYLTKNCISIISQNYTFPTPYTVKKSYKISNTTLPTNRKIFMRAETIDLGVNFVVPDGAQLSISTCICE